jgi:PAS domain-containing protein
MNSAASMHEPSGWLVEDGLRELEQLFRAVLSHQSEPILIVDDDRRCVHASSGASKLVGLALHGEQRCLTRTSCVGPG